MNYVVINDVREPLIGANNKPSTRFIHHATIARGMKTYIIYRDRENNCCYLEEVEKHRAETALKRIKDDNEWQDLYEFAKQAGFLSIDLKHEIKTSNVNFLV